MVCVCVHQRMFGSPKKKRWGERFYFTYTAARIIFTPNRFKLSYGNALYLRFSSVGPDPKRGGLGLQVKSKWRLHWEMIWSPISFGWTMLFMDFLLFSSWSGKLCFSCPTHGILAGYVFTLKWPQWSQTRNTPWAHWELFHHMSNIHHVDRLPCIELVWFEPCIKLL